jgi:hypothetical protein
MGHFYNTGRSSSGRGGIGTNKNLVISYSPSKIDGTPAFTIYHAPLTDENGDPIASTIFLQSGINVLGNTVTISRKEIGNFLSFLFNDGDKFYVDTDGMVNAQGSITGGVITVPSGNQVVDMESGNYFESTPAGDGTWTTTTGREGQVALLHIDNTGVHTLAFGSGFTDVASITDAGIVNKLLYYDGATWREIALGGGGALPAGIIYQILIHDGDSWTAEDFISLSETEDPPNTTEDVAIIWQANGVGSGQPGDVFIKIHQGGNPGENRTYKLVDWDRGVNTSPIQYGQDFTWVFKMVDATDFASPETGKTPAVTISKNGGAFAGLTGTPAVTEISNGWYKVTVDADDMVLGVVILKATAAGCAQEDMAIYM